MIKETIFEMTSSYRDSFRIKAYKFGSGRKTLAIVGTMRGDEVQQQYICARLVSELTKLEQQGNIAKDKSVVVIPSCNPFALNVSSRFWAMDNTDINRMFPGYDKGETTQRIAAAVFNAISDYEYGIQMASFYVPGDFVPHVRMLKTGYEAINEARLFGLPFVTLRKPLPFDTGLLNYNWQVWNCKAFSLYSGATNHVQVDTANQTINSVVRFMRKTGIITHQNIYGSGYESIVIDEDNLHNVKARHAGIIQHLKNVGDVLSEGESIARIIHPYDGTCLEEVKSPVDGLLFFATNKPIILQNHMLYRVL